MTTLVYDGDCGFCSSAVRALGRLGIRADVVIPWQRADLDALGLTPEQCSDKVQWVGDHGEQRSGHEAVAALLLGSGPWKVVGRLLTAPGIAWIAAHAYDWIAAHRMSLPGGTPACQVPPSQ